MVSNIIDNGVIIINNINISVISIMVSQAHTSKSILTPVGTPPSFPQNLSSNFLEADI